MLFSEPIFFLFFSAYFGLHLLLPRMFMLGLVLIGSSVFYGYWNPAYLPLPILLTLFTHLVVRSMLAATEQRTKKLIMGGGITLLLLPLIFFKYTNFLLGTKVVHLALPLGISFMTFTLIAYLVDVYKGKFPPEKSFLYLLSTVIFFPHLIAGPIVRPSQLLPQLKRWDPKATGRLTFGLLIFAVGLFKKLMIADPIGAVVDQTYLNLHATTSAWAHLMAFYGFTIQIYCDFSGYTDMALGISHVLGIRLPTNFNRPYVAANPVDFWDRWHITLSTWLRDYLYIPLGGNRKGWPVQIRNIFITMGLGGLWHGANWTFLYWGLFHAAGISIYHVFRKQKIHLNLPHWLKVVLTFHFISVGWVYFRATSVGDAHLLIRGLFSKGWDGFSPAFYYPLALFGVFFATHFLDRHRNFRFLQSKIPRIYPLLIVLVIVILCAVLSDGNSAEFIYFDF